MKKKATKKILNKEEIAEDWCFVCKDGGLLLVCDYKQCLKAYHTECAGKDDSFPETGDLWTCRWHFCFICHKRAKFHCFCCPNSVCSRCISAAEFACVRGDKGFCNHCLKLALLGEEKIDIDSDGERVDFDDRDTYEGLFMEYWETIKEKEGLTLKHLHSANARLKEGKNNKSGSETIESDKEEESHSISDYDDEDDIEEHKPVQKKKISKGKHLVRKREVKSNKREFIGWGSKSLVDFLASIGKDTSRKISQHDAASIINVYINENKLFQPEKRKKILCDEKLKNVLGKKIVNRNKIYDLLEPHFLENLEPSEEDELGYSSEDEDENVLVARKKQRKSSTHGKSQDKEGALAPNSCFASIVAENIKLVYLKRSLVQELLKQPETFECKVRGSFVRVKSDPNDYLQRNSHQLVQVTGMKKISVEENSSEIVLQVSNMSKDIYISMLSDNCFSEEECEELRQKVKGGLLTKPTIAELEQKAKNLHEDITKHWIARELALLHNLINQANEKGWRNELLEYLKRRQLLQTPSEQLRLLQEFPKVIAEVEKLEPMANDAIKEFKQVNESSPKSTLLGSWETPGDKWGSSNICSVAKVTKTSIPEELPQQSHIIVTKVDGRQKHFKASVVEELPAQSQDREYESNSIHLSEPHPSSFHIAGQKQSQPKDSEQKMTRNQEASGAQVIELSSDDDGSDNVTVTIGKQKKLEDQGTLLWHCAGPNGERKGPHSLSLLKRWSETSPFALKFKVWKAGQSEENAISLSNAVLQLSPED